MTKKWMFLSGPGDVVGTFKHWKAGRQDPRVPVQTYSHMLYDLAEAHEARLTLIHGHADKVHLTDGRYRFAGLLPDAASGTIDYFWKQAAHAQALARSVHAEDPDLVIVSSHIPPATLPLLPKRAQVVYTMHNSFWPMTETSPSGWRDRVKHAVRKISLRRLNGAVCTSEECARQLRSVVGEGIPIRVQRPVMSETIEVRHPPERPTALIYVGRIEDNKGVFMLLEMFERLAASRTDLSLVFVGDGTALDRLQDRVTASPVANRLKVTGRLGAADVHRTLAASDLLVCPTKTAFNEGLAMVGLEAVAHGVPSVLSSVVPARDLLGPACAVFQADDADDLAQTLGNVLDSTERYKEMTKAAAGLSVMLQDPSETWGVQLGRVLDEVLTS